MQKFEMMKNWRFLDILQIQQVAFFRHIKNHAKGDKRSKLTPLSASSICMRGAKAMRFHIYRFLAKILFSVASCLASSGISAATCDMLMMNVDDAVQSSDGQQMKPTHLCECGADRRFSESIHGKLSASWDTAE